MNKKKKIIKKNLFFFFFRLGRECTSSALLNRLKYFYVLHLIKKIHI